MGVKDCAGFYTVRALGPLMDESVRILRELVSPLELDRITKDYGWAIGFAKLVDEVGLDIASHVTDNLVKHYGPRIGGSHTELINELV